MNGAVKMHASILSMHPVKTTYLSETHTSNNTDIGTSRKAKLKKLATLSYLSFSTVLGEMVFGPSARGQRG